MAESQPLSLHLSPQVAWWLGSIQPSDDFYRTAGIAVLSFAAIATGLAYASGHGGTTQGGERACWLADRAQRERMRVMMRLLP